MADDVQDIAIYTGSEWTSLSELAAGVVDAKLPIKSVDGTVVLSDSSGSFVARAETGTAELNSNKNGWNNRFIVSNNTFTYDTGVVNQESKRYVKETDGTSTQVVKEGVYGLTTTVNSWGAVAGHTLFRNLVGPHVIQAEKHFRAITTTPNNDPDVTDPTAGIYLVSSGAAGQVAYFSTSQSEVRCENTTVQLRTQSSPNSSKRTRFTVADTVITSEVNIKAPSVSGPADSDAEVTLGGSFTVSTGGEERLRITEDDIKASDGYVPKNDSSLATKKIVDDKIWVGTTASYNSITKNPTTLYCLTD